jgi:hypothetical protein
MTIFGSLKAEKARSTYQSLYASTLDIYMHHLTQY